MEGTLAKFPLIHVKEFPEEDIHDAMRIVTANTTWLDAPIVLVMSRFPILLEWIGVTLRAAHSHVVKPRIKLLGRVIVFRRHAQPTHWFVVLEINENLMAGRTNADPGETIAAPTHQPDDDQDR